MMNSFSNSCLPACGLIQLSTFSTCVALVTLKHLLQKNSKCRNLLENDTGGGSLSGLVSKYQPDATDPNLSGALASVLWELSLLMKHYNPSISSMATSIVSMGNVNPAQSQVFLSAASPQQAFRDASVEHELSKPISKSAISRKKRRELQKDYVLMDPEEMQKNGNLVDENEVRRKLEDRFAVHKVITENQRLSKELNHILSSISLYEEYNGQKKQKRKGIAKSVLKD